MKRSGRWVLREIRNGGEDEEGREEFCVKMEMEDDGEMGCSVQEEAERRGRWERGRKEIREGRVSREGEMADPVASAHEEDRDEGEGLSGR